MDRSLRNVLVVSLGFLLLFTAYGGLQNLQVSGVPWCDPSFPTSLGLQECLCSQATRNVGFLVTQVTFQKVL